MKKIVGILAAAALTASMFAVDFSANVQGKFNIASKDGFGNIDRDDMKYGNSILSASAEDEKAGASFQVRVDGGSWNVYLHEFTVWVKPIDMFKLSFMNTSIAPFGKYECFDWDKLGLDGGSMDSRGFNAELTPVDGLWVGYHMNAFEGNSVDGNHLADMELAGALTYDIAGVGNVGVEVAKENVAWTGFGVGFDLKAVENLTAKVVGAFFLPQDGNKNATKIEAVVGYKAGALNFTLFERAGISSMDNSVFKNVLAAKVGYDVSENIGFNFRFAWGMNVESVSHFKYGDINKNDLCVNVDDNNYANNTVIDVQVGVPVKFGNATLEPKFNFSSSKLSGKLLGVDIDQDAVTSWSIPLSFTYNF